MKRSTIPAIILVAALACEQNSSASAFAPSFFGAKSAFAVHTEMGEATRRSRLYSEMPRDMSQMGFLHDESPHRKKRDKSSLLSAVAIDAPLWETGSESLWNQIQPILSTALLITGNTVGASCLVLPEVAARPGMMVSTALFFGKFVFCIRDTLVLVYVNLHLT